MRDGLTFGAILLFFWCVPGADADSQVFEPSYFVDYRLKAPAPKQEMRAAWVSSAWNIDFPSKPDLSVEQLKKEIRKIVQDAHYMRLNSLIFQVRPFSDALYRSDEEPPSIFLQKDKGVGESSPSLSFDPLEYFIEESKKVNIEVHAWVNPFRASSGEKNTHKNHVVHKHPEWLFQAKPKMQWMNPALPEARNYVKKIVKDIATRYDLAGIHLDDYFYPYPRNGQDSFDDSGSPGRPTAKEALVKWRQNNINTFIQELSSELKQIKGGKLRFGVSPFGIADAETAPKGVQTGLNPPEDIAADAEKWLREGWVDYMAPQLYWKTGGQQDFRKLNNHWQNETPNPHGRHIYPGLSVDRVNNDQYRYESKTKLLRTEAEFLSQVQTARSAANRSKRNSGQIFWHISALSKNQKLMDDVRTINQEDVLVPIMEWKCRDQDKIHLDGRWLKQKVEKKQLSLDWTQVLAPEKKVKNWVIQAYDRVAKSWVNKAILEADVFTYHLDDLGCDKFVLLAIDENNCPSSSIGISKVPRPFRPFNAMKKEVAPISSEEANQKQH